MKTVRTFFNLFLCFLLTTLGIGCSTKKAAQGHAKKYGVPVEVRERRDANQQASDTIASEAELREEPAAQRVVCKYGIPATMFQTPDTTAAE